MDWTPWVNMDDNGAGAVVVYPPADKPHATFTLKPLGHRGQSYHVTVSDYVSEGKKLVRAAVFPELVPGNYELSMEGEATPSLSGAWDELKAGFLDGLLGGTRSRKLTVFAGKLSQMQFS